MVGEDLFQETKSDFFQDSFYPGRQVLEETRRLVENNIADIFGITEQLLKPKVCFTYDPNNTSPWITVVFRSVYDATRASVRLPTQGLNVYYPKTRYKEAAIQANWEMRKDKGKEIKEKWVPAFGRYLLIQLPEDQETFENITIDEEMLGGPFNQNGVVTILAVNGCYSLSSHAEILHNRRYHEQINKDSNPKLKMRFVEGETVRVNEGLHKGISAVCLDDVPLSYKLKTKTRIKLGRNSAIYYIKIGCLEKT